MHSCISQLIEKSRSSSMNLNENVQPPVALAPPDRRRFPRCTVNVQIEIRPDGSGIPLRLETTDLSRGGCYVQIMLPLSLGKRLGATLWLDGAPIVVRGLVVTRHPSFGNGIMFLDFEGEGGQVLNRYMDKLIGR
jgi:hypothetical protein